ncbi:MAG TPA: DUF2800 domain-containing protein, partial [Planctomycetaceae bacterium]|nr:DUF2800 domain-containing protein [Planctomycetaceae bacterium]
DAALDQVPEEFVETCELIQVQALPIDGASWASEVAFAWDPRTDTARELGRGMDRDYSSANEVEICGTCDVVGITDESVVIIDYKTGWGAMAGPGELMQTRFYALAAARTYGKRQAIVGLIHIREDGSSYYRQDVLEFLDLEEIAGELGWLILNVADAKKDGATPVLGEHCRYCPAFRNCPAQQAAFALVLNEPVVEITQDNAAAVWERIRAAKKIIEQADKAVRMVAEIEPVELGNGKVLAAVETTRESIDGGKAVGPLKARFGDDVVDAACKISTSKAAIERALRPVAKAQGVPLAKLKREAMEELSKAGAVTRKVIRSVKEVRAEKLLEAKA